MNPLRQYNPNQLYRYQPYTPEELAAIKAQREAEELAARLQAQANMPVEETAPVCECEDKAKKVKGFGIGALILSIILFGLAVWSAVGIYMSNMLSFATTADILFVGGSIAMVVVGLAGIIHASVRIAGKCKCRGWIIGLLYIVAFLASFAGSIFIANNRVVSMDVLADFIKNDIMANVLSIVMGIVPALVHLIVCACSPRAKKCKCGK